MSYLLIHRPLCPKEQLPDPFPQGDSLRSIGSAAGIDPVRGSLLGILQGGQGGAQVRHPEGRQARLPGAEEIAGSP